MSPLLERHLHRRYSLLPFTCPEVRSMRTIYHIWFSPFCRKVRIVLAEKQLEFDLKSENTIERREDFLKLNPAGDVPVLVEEDGSVVANSTAIMEYLEETHPDPPLFPGTPSDRAEVRRLVAWFDIKFNSEVTHKLVGEKVVNSLLRRGAPDSRAIHAGRGNIHVHLEYIGWLSQRRNWLAGDKFSVADIAAAAHLSCLDYIGDVPWKEHQAARDWYARIKSRPSFREILRDKITSLPPSDHYADLDF